MSETKTKYRTIKAYNESKNTYDYYITNPYTGMDTLAFRIYLRSNAKVALVTFAGIFGEDNETEITVGWYDNIKEAEDKAKEILKIPNY